MLDNQVIKDHPLVRGKVVITLLGMGKLVSIVQRRAKTKIALPNHVKLLDASMPDMRDHFIVGLHGQGQGKEG